MDDWELEIGVDGQDELVPPMWERSEADDWELEDEYFDPFPERDSKFDDLTWNVVLTVLTWPLVRSFRIATWVFRVERHHASRRTLPSEKGAYSPKKLLLPASN